MTRLIDADKLEGKKFKCSFTDNDYSKGWNDALDAIMENEPTITPENIEKLIDAVIEIMPKLVNSIVENVLKEDRFLIDENGHITPIKSPEKERPLGKWIFDGVYRDENNPVDNDVYHCNLCKRSIMTACTRPEDLFPFCHCGADMRGNKR